jgi:hypothetical protein
MWGLPEESQASHFRAFFHVYIYLRGRPEKVLFCCGSQAEGKMLENPGAIQPRGPAADTIYSGPVRCEPDFTSRWRKVEASPL